MEVYISGSIPDYVSEIDANLKTLWQENPYRDNWSNEEAMRFYQIAMELVFAKDKMLRIIYDFTSKFNKWGDLLQKIHGKSRLELIQLYPLLNPIKPFYIDNYKLRAIIMAFESSYQDPHGSVGVFIDNFMVRFGSNWHIAQDQQKRYFSPYCALVQSSGMRSQFLRQTAPSIYFS